MSMIGKLRQVSEFELASYKKNPKEMVRSLAGSPLPRADPQMYSKMRETLEQSPAVQRLMELQKQGQPPTREQREELHKQMMELVKQAQLMRQAAMSRHPGRSPSSALPSATELDLHKSWHCLHYLFTGKIEGSDGQPIGNAILGGMEIGGDEADTGYGPPRYLTPAEVKRVAAGLDEFPIDQKVQEYNPQAADQAGIYVAQHEPEELKEYFAQLRAFYDDAAGKGNAVLLWIE